MDLESLPQLQNQTEKRIKDACKSNDLTINLYSHQKIVWIFFNNHNHSFKLRN